MKAKWKEQIARTWLIFIGFLVIYGLVWVVWIGRHQLLDALGKVWLPTTALIVCVAVLITTAWSLDVLVGETYED